MCEKVESFPVSLSRLVSIRLGLSTVVTFFMGNISFNETVRNGQIEGTVLALTVKSSYKTVEMQL